jgi:rare lipoprotein A
VLATKSPAIPEIPAAKTVALRNVETPGTESEALKKPAAPALPIATPSAPRVRSVSTGEASWYGPGFYGNRTANGEVFRPGTLTAAHRTLPFGTKVRVTNLWNGRSAVVRINDRGPFHGRRVIDLAHGAANQLGLISSGIAQVKLEVLQAQ